MLALLLGQFACIAIVALWCNYSKNTTIRQKAFLKTQILREIAPGTKYGRRVSPSNGDFVYVIDSQHVGLVLDANLKAGVNHLLAFVFSRFLSVHYSFVYLLACMHSPARPPTHSLVYSWSRQLQCTFPDSKKGTTEIIKKKFCRKAPALGAFFRFLCMCVL